MPLAIDRDGWVRSAIAVGADPAASVADAGWACLAAPDAKPGGSCDIEASRAFVLTKDYVPGPNLITPGRFILKPGGEATLELSREPQNRSCARIASQPPASTRTPPGSGRGRNRDAGAPGAMCPL
jgi:hypothetical protein